MPYEKCRQVRGVCFYGSKLVIVFNGPKQVWGFTGGHIEPGETFTQALRRELKEEANMEVLQFQLLGWKKVTATDGSFGYQLHYVCAVRPYGAFECDPASRITKIALINPADYQQYFNWGKITDYLVKRAQELILKTANS